MIWVILILIPSLIINVLLGIGAYNLLRRVERYEDFLIILDAKLRSVLDKMRAIDIRGAFEADDEVGFIFRGLRGMIESLGAFVQTEER